mmetsp:Transcript_14469/g.48462  ORF Transcript_14469/g.48462 Transcript_14469/m.48462 type:complete len:243 (-) Transcript_14469:121-849(-)
METIRGRLLPQYACSSSDETGESTRFSPHAPDAARCSRCAIFARQSSSRALDSRRATWTAISLASMVASLASRCATALASGPTRAALHSSAKMRACTAASSKSMPCAPEAKMCFKGAVSETARARASGFPKLEDRMPSTLGAAHGVEGASALTSAWAASAGALLRNVISESAASDESATLSPHAALAHDAVVAARRARRGAAHGDSHGADGSKEREGELRFFRRYDVRPRSRHRSHFAASSF